MQKAAQLSKISTIEFCRKNSEKFRILSQKFSVSNTHFLRTTQGENNQKSIKYFVFFPIENHKKTVAKVWQKLEQNKLIQTSFFFFQKMQKHLKNHFLKKEIMKDIIALMRKAS